MNYPKIGIRPAIDGRQGGVRESLEAQTMAMAQAAKELIEGSLCYADGQPVQCVVASRTIGGRADAEAARCEFLDKNVVATLTVTPCWCYGTETLDLDPATIKAVWGFNGTERPGAVYLAAAMAAHAQCGLPAFKIYGRDVQDADDSSIPADVEEKIVSFARAAVAAGQMRGKAYVNLGASAMGIAGSQVNVDFFQKYLGMSVEFVDMTEILRRMALHIYDEDEVARARAWIERKCPEGVDINLGRELPRIITDSKVVPADEDWDFIARQVVIIRDILFGNPKLAEMGWLEPSPRPQRHRRRLPGTAPVDRLAAQRRFRRGHHNLHLRLERSAPAHRVRHGERYPERRLDAVGNPVDQHGPHLLRRPHVLEPRSRRARVRQEA